MLSLKIALASLAAHKLRTILAMLGVFLGAMALTGVQHVSRAMLIKAEQETAKLGTNLFVARTGQVSFRRSGSARTRNEARTFTVQDATALIRGLPEARRGTPFVTATMPIKAGRQKTNCQLVAAYPSYAEIRNATPEFGRFFNEEELSSRARVCVLGRTIAERLFGSPEQAVGNSVIFYRAALQVVGVIEEKGADLNNTDQDEQVFVPLTTYMRRMANQDWITGVYIELTSTNNLDGTKTAATAILRKRHRITQGEQDDFSVLTAKDTMQLQQQALDLVNTLGLISSSLSFAVGGLGILSIMVLLVRTRRTEIGIRRAVGAKRSHIVRQFVLEAGIMAVIGGTLGVTAGAGLLALVYTFGKMPFVYEPALILGPLFGSALLGLAAGAYPAWMAARVEVLEVLKV
jgi:putative ABC transport system permease protein